METYEQMKERHNKEVNAFPQFYAFSEKQFAEGMARLGLDPSDTHLVCKADLGIIRKSDQTAYDEMWDRVDRETKEAIENDPTGDGFIYEMFLYELKNHEFCVTFSLESTLGALGLSHEQVHNSGPLHHGLSKAIRAEKKWAVKNGYL